MRAFRSHRHVIEQIRLVSSPVGYEESE